MYRRYIVIYIETIYSTDLGASSKYSNERLEG